FSRILRSRSWLAAVGVLVEVGGAQGAGHSGECFKQRLERRQPAPISVGLRDRQPLVNTHSVAFVPFASFTEIAIPSLIGTIDVISCGCAARRSLYSAMARVSPASRCRRATNPGTTSPSHSTLSVTSRPPGRS